MNPNRSSARIASALETQGSLGIVCLENGHQRTAGILGRELIEIQLGRFLQVGDGFFDTLALADRPHFGAIRYVNIPFFVQNRSEAANWHLNSPDSCPISKNPVVTILSQRVLSPFNHLLRDLLTQFDGVEWFVLRETPQDGQLRPHHVAVGNCRDYFARRRFDFLHCL